jgi:hypothetical protein
MARGGCGGGGHMGGGGRSGGGAGLRVGEVREAPRYGSAEPGEHTSAESLYAQCHPSPPRTTTTGTGDSPPRTTTTGTGDSPPMSKTPPSYVGRMRVNLQLQQSETGPQSDAAAGAANATDSPPPEEEQQSQTRQVRPAGYPPGARLPYTTPLGPWLNIGSPYPGDSAWPPTEGPYLWGAPGAESVETSISQSLAEGHATGSQLLADLKKRPPDEVRAKLDQIAQALSGKLVLDSREERVPLQLGNTPPSNSESLLVGLNAELKGAYRLTVRPPGSAGKSPTLVLWQKSATAGETPEEKQVASTPIPLSPQYQRLLFSSLSPQPRREPPPPE